jgi:hypothetical protein
MSPRKRKVRVKAARHLSAQDVWAMNEDQYKWYVFDMLQKGNDKMDSLCRSQLAFNRAHNKLVKNFEDHCSDKMAHPNGTTTRERILNKENGILGALITAIVLALNYIGGS